MCDTFASILLWCFYYRHGRDNKLHVWDRVSEPTASASIRAGGITSASALSNPKLCYSMDVNSLNYCRFSLLPTPLVSTDSNEALIALPNLIESSYVCTLEFITTSKSPVLNFLKADIWSLPSCQRVHAAIGKDKSISVAEEILSSDGRGGGKTGACIYHQLFAKEPFKLLRRIDHVDALIQQFAYRA